MVQERTALRKAYYTLGNYYFPTFRLPSEAEWEYACRAGSTTPFSTGENLTTGQANYNGNHPYKNYPKGNYAGNTTPAGSYTPNAWGLYDMHGTVWEWCMDWYGVFYMMFFSIAFICTIYDFI